MSVLRTRAFRHYVVGLLGTFFGAWLSGVTGSMLPLALGAAALLLLTAPLVKAAWSMKAARGNLR